MPQSAMKTCPYCQKPYRDQCNCGKKRPRYEKRTKSYSRRYECGKGWEKARLTYLGDHPLCVDCERNGRTTAATVVHHLIAHKGDPDLFWDQDNWEASCTACHNKRTARGE